MGKKCGKFKFLFRKSKKSSKSLDKNWQISKSLNKSQKSWLVSICHDDLDKYLNKDKSRLKNLDFKNLDQE